LSHWRIDRCDGERLYTSIRTIIQIQIYRDAFLVDTIPVDDIATAMQFGRFGREEGSLIITTRTGRIIYMKSFIIF
jgi:hypothetical protein